MSCKLGLQDVSYDPELHTGEVDFDFFESVEPPAKSDQGNDNLTQEVGTTMRNLIRSGTDSIAEGSTKIGSLMCGERSASVVANGGSEEEPVSNEESCPDTNSNEPSYHEDFGADGIPDYEKDTGSGSKDHHSSEEEDSDDHQAEISPGSPSTERLQAVFRDVTAIQENLNRLKLSSGASRVPHHSTNSIHPQISDPDPTPPHPSDPIPARSSAPCPSLSSAAAGPGRLRRPRPRSGWPQRKRWSSSLAEAALTQRQIAQLLRAESDSSSSDMVGVSDSDSDSGAARSAEVETWLGGATGRAAGSAARSGVSSRSQAVRPLPAAGRGSSPAGPGPAGRLGLLAEAVRHLDRTKPRTAPPAPRRPVRAPHRKNMSFTNEEVRQIDRNNRILLNKIVAQQRRPPSRPAPPPGAGRSRDAQEQLRRENMILLRKIRTARPSRSIISGFLETPPPVRPILERGAVRHRSPWVDP